MLVLIGNEEQAGQKMDRLRDMLRVTTTPIYHIFVKVIEQQKVLIIFISLRCGGEKYILF